MTGGWGVTHRPVPVEQIMHGNHITCPNCQATTEDEQIALVERLVAYHPIIMVDGEKVVYATEAPHHVSWYTRKLPNIGPIVFVAACLRCDCEFALPEQFRRAEQE
jgi:hypothetical protein